MCKGSPSQSWKGGGSRERASIFFYSSAVGGISFGLDGFTGGCCLMNVMCHVVANCFGVCVCRLQLP